MINAIYRVLAGMSYCLNPACQNPRNPADPNLCLSCGSKLLLWERYRAIEVLGVGGMARTFLASDEDKTGDRCVIKQFLPIETRLGGSFSDNGTLEKATELFNLEAQRLHELGEHPLLPTLLDCFEQDRRLYLVQEFIEGQSLLKELQHGAFSEQQIRELLNRLLPVLKFIHDREIVHGDIKPDNIRRRPSGELVLIDFGLSRQLANIGLARTGTKICTQGYAALEQIRGGKAYPASDLYSLGVTCIQLLTQGCLDELYDPLQGRWVWREDLHKRGSDLSENLERVLDKLLKDGIQERYQEASEVLRDLNVAPLDPLPPSAPSPPPPPTDSQFSETKTWSCDRTLTEHSGWVWSVALSPDGKTLASGSNDNTIILWDLGECAPRCTLKGHSDMVLSVAFSPNNERLLASGSRDKTIILWDAGTGERIRTLSGWFSGHSELVNSVAFSPDGKTLASGSWDRSIILWDAIAGKRLYTLNGHSDWVYSVAFSPDGRILASGSRDTTIILWDVVTGKQLRTLSGDAGLVNSVTFSPDGKTIASGSFDQSIMLWDVETGVRKSTLVGHSERVNSVAFSPRSPLLASCSRDRTIVLWDVRNGAQVGTLRGHEDRVFSVAFSPRSPLLASASGDETVKIWRLK